jgi:hypothetical protein
LGLENGSRDRAAQRGLDVSTDELRGWKRPKVSLPPPKRVCSIKGCGRAYVAKGFAPITIRRRRGNASH